MSYYDQELLCAGKDLIKEMRRNREANDDMQKKELAARNRVDISLDEYLAIRDGIKELEEQVQTYKTLAEADNMLYKKLGLNVTDIPFIGDMDVERLEDRDPISMHTIMQYKITFNVKR